MKNFFFDLHTQVINTEFNTFTCIITCVITFHANQYKLATMSQLAWEYSVLLKKRNHMSLPGHLISHGIGALVMFPNKGHRLYCFNYCV